MSLGPLPAEIVVQILKLTDSVRDFDAFALTCRANCSLARGNDVWERVYRRCIVVSEDDDDEDERHYLVVRPVRKWNSYNWRRRQQRFFSGRVRAGSILPDKTGFHIEVPLPKYTHPWLKRFGRRETLLRAWRWFCRVRLRNSSSLRLIYMYGLDPVRPMRSFLLA